MVTKGENTRYIAYFRVSTAAQGRSGLGLDAQREAVRAYINGNGARVLEEYVEVESGRKADRPQLLRALAQCKLLGAVLVIAKLDRLSRSVSFIAALMDSGVDFIAVDFPEANRLTVHILAAVAEHEREMISSRTKAALAAAKARGVKLGNDNLTAAARAKGRRASALALAKRARERAALVIPTIRELQAGGASLHKVAEALNAKGVPSPRGGRWYGSSIRNALALDDDA